MTDQTIKTVRLRELERRDLWLWAIAILMIVALTVTIIGIQAPQLIGAPSNLSMQLKVYLVGLSLLVVLFCGYVGQSVANLRTLKKQLSTTELEKAEIQSLLDTVRERTEQLQDSEANYRSLLERNVDASLVVDRGGNVRYVNPAAELLLGQHAVDLLGRPFQFPLNEHERSEIVVTRPDGGKVVAEMRVIEATWEKEPVWLTSLRDITARKQAENALKSANEDLKKLDQMKTDFISMVSHELRTPLTSIKNAVRLLESGKAGSINERQKHFLKLAVRNINRLAEIVNDLLDLSRIEAGELVFSFSEVDLHGVMSHLAATFTPQAESNSLALELRCPEDLPSVYADRARIEQVLCNLLGNAIKFTPAGGRVVLSAVGTNERVEVSVIDTGCGISPDDQQRIFEQFYQVGDTLTRTSKGSGLGLAITRQLIEAHGETIAVDSEVGKGSRFFFPLLIYSKRTLELASFEIEMQHHRDNPCMSLLLIEPDVEEQPGVPVSGMASRIDLLEVLAVRIRELLPRASDKIIVQPVSRRIVIWLTGTPKGGALVVQKKFIDALSETPLMHCGAPVAVSVSGPATCLEDGTTARELIANIQSFDAKPRRPYGKAENSRC